MKLKTKEIKAYRAKLLKQQKGMCALCGEPILEGEDTLDHCHDTGNIRKVLHRSCNQSEGRIKSWIKRSRATDSLLFLRNLLLYWESDYSENPIHPTHLSENQKEIQRLKKRMKKVKTEKTKQRYRDRIKELQDEQ